MNLKTAATKLKERGRGWGRHRGLPYSHGERHDRRRRRSKFRKDEYADVRARWTGIMLGRDFPAHEEPYASRLKALGENADRYRGSMVPATGSLWPDLDFSKTGTELSRKSGNMQESYERLRTMAQAYAQPGTGHTGSAVLREGVLLGLRHLRDQVYNENTQRYGNWYHWQIGAPQRLLDTCVLLHPHLAPADRDSYLRAVDHFVPDSAVGSYTGTSTGANRVDLCRVLALRGAVGERPAKITLARDALSPVFPYVTAGDGIYADGSFVQHTTVAYTGSYGQVLLDGLARLLALLGTSRWAVTDPQAQNVFDAVDRSYAPCLYNGLMMDHVSGRAISRPGGDHGRGRGVIAAVVLLAESASAVERARWRSMAKGWLKNDTYVKDPLAGLGIDTLSRIKPLLDDEGTAPAPEPVRHMLFPAMARAVHRRPTWAAAVSMASWKITHYETGNGENLRGWHTGQGMLYVWNSTTGLGQYSDAFWPTVDPYRLPGTTVSKKQLKDGQGGDWGASCPDVRWVGGATDGTYAAIGQNIRGLGSTLRAKKSWFFLDDCVVCLGADINSSDGVGVETIVDNRNLGERGTHTLTVDGEAQPGTLPWSATLTGATWAHLAGFHGYIFIGGVNLQARREERTGCWRDINTGGSTTPLTRRYLTLYLAHGKTKPPGSNHAYVVLPGASIATVKERSDVATWLTIHANNEKQQGISVPRLGLRAVNFWYSGTVGPFVCEAPASILTRESGTTGTLCVSDPKRTDQPFGITWNRKVAAVTSHDDTIEVLGTGDSLRLRVTPGAAGATHRCTVTLG
ncbi:polysaccharide lyase 8 family protein [Streptomyces sp. NPDC057555]|uniref:polysaccharide lyase 8 family protein n=1 Tax=Streptomyces sp. NPDC057555 TaxID=3346166 RepID=UPI0036D0E9E9